MCIIMVKPKGVKLPSKETFRTCFNHNPDGCGYMYVKNGELIIKKGFMGYKNMYKQLERLGDINIVVHFRIGTSGKNDQKTCHPYPISREVADLQAGYIKSNVGVVHNGVISGYNGKDKVLNDTQLYIQDRMCMLQDLNPTFYANDNVLDFLYKDTYTKFVFLDNNDELYYSGSFIKEDDGMIYSNSTYKSVLYTNYAYNTYHYDDDYYASKSSVTKALTSPYSTITDSDNEIDEIDYLSQLKKSNYIVLNVGDLVQIKYDHYIDIEKPDRHALDINQNLLLLDSSLRPIEILYPDVVVYNQSYEEIYV